MLELIKLLSTIISINAIDCDAAVYGLYYPNEDQMILCTNNIDSREIFNETVKHEAIHVVQDCVVDIDNAEIALINPISTLISHPNHYYAITQINQNYRDLPAYIQWIEVEAFIYESTTTEDIIDLINTHCR